VVEREGCTGPHPPARSRNTPAWRQQRNNSVIVWVCLGITDPAAPPPSLSLPTKGGERGPPGKSWWRPLMPVEPMYMPGRFRTGSRPSRTWMEDAPYPAAEGACGVVLPAGGGKGRAIGGAGIVAVVVVVFFWVDGFNNAPEKWSQIGRRRRGRVLRLMIQRHDSRKHRLGFG